MTLFDQQSQQMNTQYNAGQNIIIQKSPVSFDEQQQQRYRTRILQRVQSIWIDDVLEPSLHGAAEMTLALKPMPDALVTSQGDTRHEFERNQILRLEANSIIEAYDRANGELLILGSPGSGKTTFLLHLLLTLLGRARQDEAHPIPLVFLLSSWSNTRLPLTAWLTSELSSTYQISRLLAASWIETGQVLPLLDGLSEVSRPHQAACVQAINDYRQAYGFLPTVVCSQTAEYLGLPNHLRLRTAVVVQPPTAQQIHLYLTSGGQRLAGLSQRLQEDTEVATLIHSPLILNMLMLAFRDVPAEQIIATPTSQLLQQNMIVAAYVHRMLTHRGSTYTSQQTTHWLRYLAQQMQRHNHSVFYLEQMQATWLPTPQMRRTYERWATRMLGLFIGACVAIASTFNLVIKPTLPFLVTSTLLGCMFGWLLSAENGAQQHPGSAHTSSKPPGFLWLQSIPLALIVGLGCGLSFGLSFGLNAGLSITLSTALMSMLLHVLFVPRDRTKAPPKTPPPIAGFLFFYRINRRAISHGLLAFLLVGLTFGLNFGFNFELLRQLTTPLDGGLRAKLTLGLNLGLSYALSYGLNAGLSATVCSMLLIGKSSAIQATDMLVWSWKSMCKSLFSVSHMQASIVIVIVLTLGRGLNIWLAYLLSTGSDGLLHVGFPVGLGTGLSYGITMGLNYWLLFGLIQGVSSKTIEDEQRITPNQGIFSSGLNALKLGITSTIIAGVCMILNATLKAVLDVEFGIRLSVALNAGVAAGLSIGLLVGSFKGGVAWLRHRVLRLLLSRTGLVPYAYSRFLDDAARRSLLRKVGGGYMFIHKIELDYFVTVEQEPKEVPLQ